LHWPEIPSLSRGGLGWRWVLTAANPKIYPISLLTSPLEGGGTKVAKSKPDTGEIYSNLLAASMSI